MKKLKAILTKIYKKFDKGDPSWLSFFKSIRIEISFKFPFKEWKKARGMDKLIKTIMPDYVSLSNKGWIFLHEYKIPKGSDPVLELKKLIGILKANGFKKSQKIEADMDKELGNNSFSSRFEHDLYGGVYLHIYFSDSCDIEYVEETIKKPQITGICEKVLEELNAN